MPSQQLCNRLILLFVFKGHGVGFGVGFGAVYPLGYVREQISLFIKGKLSEMIISKTVCKTWLCGYG